MAVVLDGSAEFRPSRFRKLNARGHRFSKRKLNAAGHRPRAKHRKLNVSGWAPVFSYETSLPAAIYANMQRRKDRIGG